MGDLAHLGDWISERTHHSDPLPPAVTLTLAALITLTTIGAAWNITQIPATIAHELGHAYLGRLSGRTVHGIQLHTDTSGATHTAGNPHGLGYFITLLAGYTTPPTVGAALTWAALNGWSGAALMATAFLLLIAVPLSRNLLALTMIGATAALMAATVYIGDTTITTALTQLVGVYLGVAGIRATVSLIEAHRHHRGAGSDADQLRHLTLIPTTIWVTTFTVYAAAAFIWQALLILNH